MRSWVELGTALPDNNVARDDSLVWQRSGIQEMAMQTKNKAPRT